MKCARHVANPLPNVNAQCRGWVAAVLPLIHTGGVRESCSPPPNPKEAGQQSQIGAHHSFSLPMYQSVGIVLAEAEIEPSLVAMAACRICNHGRTTEASCWAIRGGPPTPRNHPAPMQLVNNTLAGW
jgi:hypothetical protein